MWEIQESFKDELHPIGRGLFCLNPDKMITPYHIKYPILWTGYINNTPIKILQKGVSAKYRDDFDLVEFPDTHYFVINQIIEHIDNYLRIID
jgi:hypothetical protein